MKKIGLIFVAITSLSAAGFTNPLGNSFKSTDNGGTLPAIDAYKDGVGVIVLDNLGTGSVVDNSAMNTLVYKYGEAAKISGKTVFNEVLSTSLASQSDLLLVSNANTNTNQPVIINSDYDNCEGGLLNFQDATTYCEGKGMRLPTYSEALTLYTPGNVPSCPYVCAPTDYYCGYTWTTDFGAGSQRVVWLNTQTVDSPPTREMSSMSNNIIGATANSNYVRCVKL